MWKARPADAGLPRHPLLLEGQISGAGEVGGKNGELEARMRISGVPEVSQQCIIVEPFLRLTDLGRMMLP